MGVDGQAFDVQPRGLMGELCFLDDRDADCDQVAEVLRSFGKLGVAGSLHRPLTAEQQAAAAQLREIEAGEPSSRLATRDR
jgi:hypothetical protein